MIQRPKQSLKFSFFFFGIKIIALPIDRDGPAW